MSDAADRAFLNSKNLSTYPNLKMKIEQIENIFSSYETNLKTEKKSNIKNDMLMIHNLLDEMKKEIMIHDIKNPWYIQ